MENRKATLLIVDDEQKNIFALEQFLNDATWTVLSAESGKKALATALNNNVDLILLDVMMPEMDGFEVAQILKSNKRTKDIPIIFISAKKKENEFVLKGFEEGAFDYLYQPLDPDIIKAKVSALLQLQLQRRELAEKNLALEKYALLINNASDLIAIINSDTMQIEEVNDGVNALLGYLPPEIKGSSLLYYLPQDDHFEIKKYQQEKPEKFSFESRLYTKTGAIRWFQWNIVHRSGLWLANARDITELKEAGEIKNYLATVVKQSNEAIYLQNAQGEIISWNEGAEQIYGYSEDEALRMKIWNIVPPHLLDEAHDVIDAILAGEKIDSLETKRITKFGKIIDIVFSASIIADGDGALKSIAITERDVTQQKKAEQEIRQLNADLNKSVSHLQIINKELESFSYSVSHDLRSPLTNILGYASLIEETYADQVGEDLMELLNTIGDSAKRMDTLIAALLSFSRLGKEEVTKAPVNFNALVEKVLAAYKKPELKAQIIVEPLPSAEGDFNLLYQVFDNLISNALKYSGKKEAPVIQISGFEKDDEIIYVVKDNGAGFDMKNVDKLFGVFHRLHTEQEFEGTGVGLATVQRIVVKHGGRIWAEAKLDEGATFYFALPRANA